MRHITTDRRVYRAKEDDCRACPQKAGCTTGIARRLSRHVDEDVRDQARAIAQTEAYQRSRRERRKVEMLFAHLKQQFRFRRLKLRGCPAQSKKPAGGDGAEPAPPRPPEAARHRENVPAECRLDYKPCPNPPDTAQTGRTAEEVSWPFCTSRRETTSPPSKYRFKAEFFNRIQDLRIAFGPLTSQRFPVP